MDKTPITVDGELDDMFVDDRDVRIMSLSIDATQPRYGANHLRRPKRALNAGEIEAMDQIGLPTDPTAAG